MKFIAKLLLATSFVALTASAAHAAGKNWTPPPHKIYAQQLSDQIMAEHPELLSVTFHGVPPGMKEVYTMFAGSFPDRIGNGDDPDDIDVITKAITIVDPRWNRSKDTVKKFVMMMPLRDAGNGHVGLLVLAYKNPPGSNKSETDYFVAASALRDALQKKISRYEDLFKPAQ